MKVKLNPDKVAAYIDSRLTYENEYEVVILSFYQAVSPPRCDVHIVDNSGILIICPIDDLIVCDAKVDDRWVVKVKPNSRIILIAAEIAYNSFLEDFHNDEPIAIEKFKNLYPHLTIF